MYRITCKGSDPFSTPFPRRHAEVLRIALTGTLGILLDAKRRGLVPALTPLVDDLQRLGFRLSEETRHAVLRMAGEL